MLQFFDVIKDFLLKLLTTLLKLLTVTTVNTKNSTSYFV